jgi:hypothetical protein
VLERHLRSPPRLRYEYSSSVPKIVKALRDPIADPLQPELCWKACEQQLYDLSFCAERIQGGPMADNSTSILAIQPELQRARVGWLAVSPPGSLICIGTVGDTEDEARQRFQEELQAWQRLHDRDDERPAQT